MLKFLSTAAKVAGLTYQLLTTVALLSALFAGASHVHNRRKKVG
mgnify:CR=1